MAKRVRMLLARDVNILCYMPKKRKRVVVLAVRAGGRQWGGVPRRMEVHTRARSVRRVYQDTSHLIMKRVVVLAVRERGRECSGSPGWMEVQTRAWSVRRVYQDASQLVCTSVPHSPKHAKKAG